MNDVIVAEDFKEIDQFPGYRVSNYGRLQSKLRQGSKPSIGNFTDWHDVYVGENKRTGHLFRAARNKHGKIVSIWVSRMELWSFNGPPPTTDHECRHLDGNSKNNWIGNLEWGTTKENSDDKFRHGNAIIGNRNHKTQFDETDVFWMRFLYDNRRDWVGLSARQIALRIGISDAHFRSIGLRKDRKYVPEADTLMRREAAR